MIEPKKNIDYFSGTSFAEVCSWAHQNPGFGFSQDCSNHGLLFGPLSLVLLHVHSGKYDVAFKYLEDVFSLVDQVPLNARFIDGIFGFGYTLNYLEQTFPEIEYCDFSEILENIDRIAWDAFLAMSKNKHNDFFYGSFGALCYLAPRMPRSGFLRDKYDGLLERIGQSLIVKKRYTHLPNHDAEYPGEIMFGAAHGLSGQLSIISELSNCLPSAYTDQYQSIISPLTETLLAVINPDGSVPNVIDGPGIDFSTPRWCHGELGIGACLLNCGVNLKNEELAGAGEMILAALVPQLKRHESTYEGYIFCHGSAGLNQVYARAHQRTGNPLFLKASEYFMSTTAQHLRSAINHPEISTTSMASTEGLLHGLIGASLTLWDNPHRLGEWNKALLI